MTTNLAVISPNLNAYSETFIQAHKRIPDMLVKFYYGGPLPDRLENTGKLEDKLWKSGIIHYFGKLLGSRYTDRREDLLEQSLRKEKIDCVLAEYGTTGASILKVCKKLKLPLLVIFLGFDTSVYQILREYESSYKELFQYATAIVAVSRVMQKKIEAMGCPSDKLYYSPTGPDDGFFSISPTFSRELFISAGRFVDKKAHYYTILAFHEVVKKHPDARLIIAGEGMLLNACINLVRYLKIEHAVSFPGAVSLEKFSEYLASACAYVQHSVTAMDGDMEGTPVAVLEAAAAGLPVISTRHAGIPEVIIDGETGLLVDEHDVEGMAGHMIRIIEDKDLARRLGEKGRSFIFENFSREKHLKELAQIIKGAVNLK